MDISTMKNIIVLKNLPSNLVDEAIVILKSGTKLKNKKTAIKKLESNCELEENIGFDIAVKEAENIVNAYISKMEEPIKNNVEVKNLNKKYKQLKLCSFFLGLIAICCIIVNIV